MKRKASRADKIALVAKRFFGLTFQSIGIVPDDPNVTKAVKEQFRFPWLFLELRCNLKLSDGYS